MKNEGENWRDRESKQTNVRPNGGQCVSRMSSTFTNDKEHSMTHFMQFQ